MNPQILGIHHVSAYHLFYADAKGSPGSDLTFFDWAHSSRQRHGNNSVSRTGLRPGGVESLQWWIARFDQFKVSHSPIFERGGRSVVDFQDAEGQPLSLVDDGSTGESFPWSGSPVPPSHQIRGLGPATITVPKLESTGALLTDVLGMRPTLK